MNTDTWPYAVAGIITVTLLRNHARWDGTIVGPSQETLKWQNCTSGRESDGISRIRNPYFLFVFNSSHSSISLSFGDIRVWHVTIAAGAVLRRGRKGAIAPQPWPCPQYFGCSNKCALLKSTRPIITAISTLVTNLQHEIIESNRNQTYTRGVLWPS